MKKAPIRIPPPTMFAIRKGMSNPCPPKMAIKAVKERIVAAGIWIVIPPVTQRYRPPISRHSALPPITPGVRPR